ncbi:receptor-transporting protein 3-like [Xenopus laevis]|uniref:Receptor-transporting protein 3-like n=2 Tax=Xenopus laevis TaxID=8355 RepID=A0A1L8GA76_XENLA|nr:receptor-transporting protein 3-like [Xenopus laevis]OCT80651.1 hypothetical protein XELAEV_18027464mg [Xenopus laevis]
MLRLAKGNDRWSDEFDNQIEELDTTDLWILHVIENSLPNGGLKYEQTTFGSFQCSYCRCQWSSANVHIMFLITLAQDRKCGIVKMKISRQSCEICNSGMMKTPQISHENIKRIMKNLVVKINRTFYEQEDYGRLSRSINYYRKPKGPHNIEHCEMCQQDEEKEGLSPFLAVAGVAVGIGALVLAGMAFSKTKDSSKK